MSNSQSWAPCLKLLAVSDLSTRPFKGEGGGVPGHPSPRTGHCTQAATTAFHLDNVVRLLTVPCRRDEVDVAGCSGVTRSARQLRHKHAGTVTA